MSLKDGLKRLSAMGKNPPAPQGCVLSHVERNGTNLALQFMRADGETRIIEVYASWAIDVEDLKIFAGLSE